MSSDPGSLLRQAANRLHHLSMRYAGALMELVKGKRVTLIHLQQPGLKEARDFIDIILLTRAEINALTTLLLKAKVFTADDLTKEITQEYNWLTEQKAKQLGVEVNDAGLVFHNPQSTG